MPATRLGSSGSRIHTLTVEQPSTVTIRRVHQGPLQQGGKAHSIQQKVNLLLANAANFIRGNILGNGVRGTMKLAGTVEALGIDV